MLLQFTVGNFKSFRDKATISLEATHDDWREDDNIAHLENPHLRLIKAAAIYGQNAGGKSNLIEAMVRFREGSGLVQRLANRRTNPRHAISSAQF
jgi:AAA15 family ATPase/GTPase